MSVSSIVRKIMMSQFNQAFQYFIDDFPVYVFWPSLFRTVYSWPLALFCKHSCCRTKIKTNKSCDKSDNSRSGVTPPENISESSRRRLEKVDSQMLCLVFI